MFRNQLKATQDAKGKIQQQLTSIEDVINNLQNNLNTLLSYHDFVKYKGFGIIQKWMEQFQEEIKQAENERLKEEEEKTTNEQPFSFFSSTDNSQF